MNRGGPPRPLGDCLPPLDPAEEATRAAAALADVRARAAPEDLPGPYEPSSPPPRPQLPKEVLGFCRSCHHAVYWVKLDGKPHPVERGTDPKGNIALTLHKADDSVTAERVSPGSRPNLHLSHFALCPQAAEWRQRRLKGT